MWFDLYRPYRPYRPYRRHRTPRTRALAALLSLWAATAQAQDAGLRAGPPRPLRLREALDLAAQRNPSLLISAVDTAIATAQIEQARGAEDFVLDLGASGQLARRDAVPGQPVQQTGSDGISWRSGVSRLLPIGGRLGLRFDGDYSRTTFAVNLMEDGALQRSEATVMAPALSLNLTQPLLRGVGVAVTRAPLRRAAAALDVVTLQRQAVAAAVVRDVVQGYWELACAAAELEIRRAALDLARGQLRVVQAQIAVGKAPAAAHAEVDAAITLREDEALQAERALLERSLELRRLLGLPVGPDEIALAAADPPPPIEGAGAAEGDLAQSQAQARARNPQLLQARALGRAATIEVEVTGNGLLPQLDLALSGGLTGYAGGAAQAFQQLASFRSYTVQAGLSFSLPLGQHAARGARDAARGALRRARLTEADIAAQVDAAVARAVMQARAAQARIAVLARSADLAQQNLEGERARYQVGRATSFDVLRRQEELALARLRRARAHADLLGARAALQALTGSILAEHGLALGGAK